MIHIYSDEFSYALLLPCFVGIPNCFVFHLSHEFYRQIEVAWFFYVMNAHSLVLKRYSYAGEVSSLRVSDDDIVKENV